MFELSLGLLPCGLLMLYDNTIVFMLSSTAYEGIRDLSLEVTIHIAHASRTSRLFFLYSHHQTHNGNVK